MAEAVSSAGLIPMDVFCGTEPIAIDLVYADAHHPENIFGIAAYHRHARLVLHRDLARIVIKAARLLNERHGWILVLKDGLRTVEAQATLTDTDIVRKNPHWLEEPRMLSGPGQGAHPRGMAIDVGVQDAQGAEIDMGTAFDEMTVQSARNYDGFSADILQNRRMLENAMMEAATHCGTPLLPLPSEWWDFRIPSSHYGDIAPLSDRDLPDSLKMRQSAADLKPADFTRLAKDIVSSI